MAIFTGGRDLDRDDHTLRNDRVPRRRAFSMVSLIGHKVEDLTVVDGEYVAIDSGENRVAFPSGSQRPPSSAAKRAMSGSIPAMGVERHLPR